MSAKAKPPAPMADLSPVRVKVSLRLCRQPCRSPRAVEGFDIGEGDTNECDAVYSVDADEFIAAVPTTVSIPAPPRNLSTSRNRKPELLSPTSVPTRMNRSSPVKPRTESTPASAIKSLHFREFDAQKRLSVETFDRNSVRTEVPMTLSEPAPPLTANGRRLDAMLLAIVTLSSPPLRRTETRLTVGWPAKNAGSMVSDNVRYP